MSNGAEYAALINTYVEEEEQEEAREGEPDTDVLLEVASSRSVRAAGTGNWDLQGRGTGTYCSRWPPHGQSGPRNREPGATVRPTSLRCGDGEPGVTGRATSQGYRDGEPGATVRPTSPGYTQSRDTFSGSLRVAADKIQTLSSVQFSSVHIFRIIPQRGLVSDSITRHSVTPRTNDRYTTYTYIHTYIHTPDKMNNEFR